LCYRPRDQCFAAATAKPRRAWTEADMADRRRNDPYRNFNLRMVFGAAIAAIAGFARVKKVMPGVSAKYRKPKDYVSEVPAGSRPIEAVGTSVAARRTAGKAKKRPASHGRARKKRTAAPKRR
jgi:hypothetical protein